MNPQIILFVLPKGELCGLQNHTLTELRNRQLQGKFAVS